LPPGSVDGERACDSGGVAHVGRLTCPEDQATTKISLAAAHFVITHQIQSKFTTPRKRVFAVAGGRPKVLRMDNGPELVSQALQRVCDHRGRVALHPAGTPWNHNYIESFNNRLRKECLNRNHWNSRFEARVVIGDFKHQAQPRVGR
jgi:putative transposase